MRISAVERLVQTLLVRSQSNKYITEVTIHFHTIKLNRSPQRVRRPNYYLGVEAEYVLLDTAAFTHPEFRVYLSVTVGFLETVTARIRSIDVCVSSGFIIQSSVLSRDSLTKIKQFRHLKFLKVLWNTLELQLTCFIGCLRKLEK